MKTLIGVLLLFLQMAEAEQRMGPYIAVPRITVDPKSTEGVTDNANVRCTVSAVGTGSAIVVVDLRAKKGFIDVGLNVTVGHTTRQKHTA